MNNADEFNGMSFSNLSFQGEFRRHQSLILDKFSQALGKNAKKQFKFHLVAPPGSGKTLIGFEMAIKLGKPALVICPNKAIQGQWVDKGGMFLTEADGYLADNIISIDANAIKLINVFTYQMLSVPQNDEEAFSRVAENLWAESIAQSHGIGLDAAVLRILTMKEGNPQAYKTENAKFKRKLRQSYLNDPNCNIASVLHPNAIELIKRLKDMGIDTVIFDECHHLQSYWALTMRELVNELGAANIIGLTATPPFGEEREKVECYTALLGEIDYQIPTPAVVKEGLLAPYRDLVYFCTPEAGEYEYIENCHASFRKLIEKFDGSGTDFYFWINSRIVDRKLLSGEKQDWTRFINSRPSFAAAGVKYLLKNECSLPWDVTITEDMYHKIALEDWLELIEDYSLNLLKLSSKSEDKELYDEIRNALRSLGYVLAENGIRSCGSSLDRVLAYSRSKLDSVKKILKAEEKALGEKLRAAIITDFEISDALSLKKAESVMDGECGGAVGVMKMLAADSEMELLNPVMITGNSLLCDDDLAAVYVDMGRKWIESSGYNISLSYGYQDLGGFVPIIGSGSDWNSMTAVLLTTYLFERGITRCIIGTRGLLSEGWDSLNLNTLIDLTTVTTYTSVNQLRGRSIRKSEKEPRKVADNWDIVCLAPGLEKGSNDLDRLRRKHERYYGICDDGQIQQGVNHLDPRIGMEDTVLEQAEMEAINSKMLDAVGERQNAYALWRIGESFENVELGCCELQIGKPIKMKAGSVLVNERTVLRNKLNIGLAGLAGTAVSLGGAIAATGTHLGVAAAVFGVSAFLGVKTYSGFRNMWSYGRENLFRLSVRPALQDISNCLLNALVECELISAGTGKDKITFTERSDGTLRVYLDCNEVDSKLFSESLAQIFSPIEAQRYAVQRYETAVPEGSTGRFAYLLRMSMGRCSPVLMCYHPLPEVFNVKERALIFKKYWNLLVSPGEVVFLKGENGRQVVEKFGRMNFFGAKKMNMKVWK